jgi:hypothetical protein
LSDQPMLTTQNPPSKRRGGNAVLAVAGLVAIAGLAFAVGRFTAPAAATTLPAGGFPFGSFAPIGSNPGNGFVGRGLGGGITLRGEVTAVSPDSITIKLDDGSEVTVPVDDQTSYHQATPGSVSDVTEGSTVAIQPGAVDAQPGASPDPGSGPASFSFGPAEDVTVVDVSQ